MGVRRRPSTPAERSRVNRWLCRVDRYASSPLASVLVIGAAAAWIIVSIAARCIGGSVKLPSMTIPRVVRATQQGRVRLSAARPPY